MKLILALFFLYLTIIGAENYKGAADKSLELVYVLFRHGNRTPNGPEETYPKDPYRGETWPLIGIGQLTNGGKRLEYKIGTALRKKYNDFLGPYYMPDLVDSLSSDYNRTKASLLLVLAGLFPPKGEQVWNNQFLWQPIPYNYLRRSEDKVLLGQLCPHYEELYRKYIAAPKIQAKFNRYRNTLNYISQNTGLNVTTFNDTYNLYFGLKAEEDNGLRLPAWTKKVWPEPIGFLAAQEYNIATGTLDLMRIISGYFLQKLVNDISLRVNGSNTARKLYLASAHELNVATTLVALGYTPPAIPNYGAYIVFELHKRNGVHEIEVFYQNYVSEQPVKLKLQFCGYPCPFDKFKSALEVLFPPSPNFCYET